ncbi:methyltransferase domain-containing protein [Achromobacter sp. NPDC058515]|uniref:O-linked N-acetylglucosamine transferase family protein n=1 Tax=Achromobacter sp. NPDC058515 TaxID=3346533 RepID=UPI0036693713
MSYPAFSHRQAVAEPGRLAPSHSPARLRATAHLYGVETSPLERARVLALGCGAGEGLLPYAVAYPQAQVVGVDASETLIAQGTAAAQGMGIQNLALYVGGAADLGTQLGLFDYVIVTGLYSYLPPQAAQELLEACAKLLSPQGILYLDSPVYPGAKALDVVRDAIMLHGHAAQTEAELQDGALAALTLFKDGMSASNPQGAALSAAAAQFERALGAAGQSLPAASNPLASNPCYFVELAGRASEAGLAYVGDAQPLSEIPLNFGQGVSLSHSLLTMGQPATVRQQYLDFSTGRAFRQCMWVAQARSAEAHGMPDLARLQDLRFASGLVRLAANGQEQGATYVNHQGRALITHDADVVTVVDTLAHAWPASLPFSALLAVLLHKNQVPDTDARKALDRAIRVLMENDLVHYCLDAGPYEREVDTPVRLLACLDLNQQAAPDAPWPRFNLWHESILFVPSEVHAAVLRAMGDGRRPDEAQVAGKPADLGEVAETLSIVKRYGLASSNARAWVGMLRDTLVATEGGAPLFGLYLGAQACLSLNARILSQDGHQPNPGAAIVPQAKLLHELMTRKAYVEAESTARRLTKLAPKFWDAWEALAIALFSVARLKEALLPTLQMIDLAPADAQSCIVLAATMARSGRSSEAIAAGRRAIELAPRNAEAYSALADGLAAERRFKEAEDCNRIAITLNPEHRKARINLCKTLIDAGEVTRAEQAAREAVAAFPREKMARNNLLFALNYSDDRTAEEVFQAYRDYDTELCLEFRSAWKPHKNSRHPPRKLKVGYVSPDFRQHSGNYFIEPLFAHRDRAGFELTAYAELTHPDDTTERLKTYFDHWVPTVMLTDAQLAERIRADGIDILIDVAGHTADNRLGVFARKPAPVSLTWLGFGYSTGLSAIDYIMTDAVMVPEGSEHLFSEDPWRLDTTNFVYRPNKTMGDYGPLPALANGFVTLGTLTRAIRMNDRTVRVWSEILRRLPQGRLVVDSNSYRDGPMRERLIARFEAQGIDRGRLMIGCHSPAWDVLRNMDIGLDCFPHNSGVTLVETLYMGVPYVTLADRPSVGRIGGSVLHGIGHPEWIAHTEEEYIQKVVALASDLPALARIRAGLRDEMHASPLMDEPAFARKFEGALTEMFKNWCDTQA